MDDHVVVQISDTGIEMTNETRQRCFEPFFTTKGLGQTGMGLSVVYGTAKRHSALLEVRSAPHRGTTLRMSFPLISTADMIGDKTDKTPPAIPPGPLRVLLIDDDLKAQSVTKKYLVRNGHSVVTASDGTTGIKTFKTGSFDMVITDHAMPDMSGDDVAVELRNINPDIPIILFTGFGQRMKDTGIKPIHVDIVVGKPAKEKELLRAVAHVIQMHAAPKS